MAKHIINAENRPVGRVATEVAVLLMGKNLPDFKRNAIPQVSVEIINTNKAKVTGNKISQKRYARYSGYPGGLRKPTMSTVVAKKGMKEVFTEAVWGMLPKNKLRSKMIKNLKITA
jgi:large subunit ribosomal protein L13